MKKIALLTAIAIALILATSCQQNLNVGGDSTVTAPTILTATGGDGQVALTWSNSPNAVTYKVYYKKNAVTVTTSDNTGNKSLIATNSTTITGLDNGWTYAFAVVAVGTGNAVSTPSAVMTAATGGSAAMPTFTVPAGTYAGTTNVTISSTTPGASIAYSTTGTATRSSTVVSSGSSVAIASSETLSAIAFVPGWNTSEDSTANSAAYKIIDLYLLGKNTGGNPVTWQNGTASSALSGSGMIATGMTVAGGNVYVVGYGYGASLLYYTACYWKNGTRKDLIASPTTDSHGMAIAVDGSGNVYVAGSDESKHACYWVDNGSSVSAHSFSVSGVSEANAIALSGTDVYAAGYDYYALTQSGTRRACYWLNTGSKTWVSGQTDYESIAWGIAYNGSYVMTAGTQYGLAYNNALYWQGSNAYALPPGGGGSFGFSSFYSAGTLYVAGNYQGAYTNACYWTAVPGSSPTTAQVDLYKEATSTTARSIFLSGSDLYLAGLTYVSGAPAGCYWVGDKDHKVTVAGLNEADGIYVVDR
jgi:hypothetical protein